MFKNALVSVSDKSGLAEFLKPYVKQGLRVVSTGGTAQYLRDNDIPNVDVSEQTQFPEVMDGRVKTLHPNIHMPLLARNHNAEDEKLLKQYGLAPFDLVIVNLYPFASALKKSLSSAEQIEYIDIGGPSLLRAAAKNFSRLCVICDPADYKKIARQEALTEHDRQLLAAKVFQHVSSYDSIIGNYLSGSSIGPSQSISGLRVSELRYGENPQQKAAWYRFGDDNLGLHTAEILQGKELSYNNILDLDAAIRSAMDFSPDICCVAVKHNNPCGIATGSSVLEATKRCLSADSVSVFGGIVAINHCIDKESAEALADIFLECVIAPEFSPEALSVFGQKKNLRVLRWPTLQKSSAANINSHCFRSICGGFLLQESDQLNLDRSESWKIIGAVPDQKAWIDLKFAWKVVARLKSNAIAIASNQQTIGLGMGQVNRVDAVEQAIGRMRKFHTKVQNPVLASDAFFPFADSVEKAAQAGVKYIIQPGGSMRDAEVIECAKSLGVNMILTGTRHFLH